MTDPTTDDDAKVLLGDRPVGPGAPVYVIAEIGINHNGDLDVAKSLVDAAALAGCDAVKIQKRTPELCVPPEQRDVPRETPWGVMSYMDYRHRVELGPLPWAGAEVSGDTPRRPASAGGRVTNRHVRHWLKRLNTWSYRLLYGS